jgi:predicted nucleic acid-binding protein
VRALENAAAEGLLVVCDLVYAELCIHFNTQSECDRFLQGNEIRVEALNHEAHFLASRVWRAYRKQGGQRARILADFLIRRSCARASFALAVAGPRILPEAVSGAEPDRS